jgi:hypothetical protein
MVLINELLQLRTLPVSSVTMNFSSEVFRASSFSISLLIVRFPGWKTACAVFGALLSLLPVLPLLRRYKGYDLAESESQPQRTRVIAVHPKN